MDVAPAAEQAARAVVVARSLALAFNFATIFIAVVRQSTVAPLCPITKSTTLHSNSKPNSEMSRIGKGRERGKRLHIGVQERYTYPILDLNKPIQYEYILYT